MARLKMARLKMARLEMENKVRAALLVLFTLSGFSGLIYESLWTHYLKLFLGHAAYAQSLVLAIFMGGMAAGAWGVSRLSGRIRRPLMAYALIEAAVGAFALLFHPLFVAATGWAYETVLPAMPSPAMSDLFRWGLGTALILPQSILLGATFPLMSAGVVRLFPQRPGATLASLYFVNSLGGAAGVLAAGFLLVGWLGLPGAMSVAGAINLAVALAVAALARGEGGACEPVSPAAAGDGRLPYFLLAAAFFTGLASFVYEIAWIRMLSLVLGASTHAFELMLSAFILGLALGGALIRGTIDRLANPLRFLGYVQVAMGLMALATLPLYGLSFDAMVWMVEKLPKSDWGYAQFNLMSHGIALAVMLPATICAGTTLPLATHALMRQGQGEAAIGRIYGANTLGGILGVVLAVHIGLPLLGLKSLLVAGAGVDMALGAAILLLAGGALWRGLAGGGLALAGLAAGALLIEFDTMKLASGVYRGYGIIPAGKAQVVHHKDGKTATVSISGKPGIDLAIRTNGKADASLILKPDAKPAPDESTMVLLGALPLMIHPEARRVANIGFGSGLSSHTALAYGALEAVDTIEIEPEMVEAARHFLPRNRLAYEDSRSHIVIEDAKSYFAARNARYDVIISEPSNPWVSGVAGLFSKEFYHLAARHLAPDGLFVQWLQIYEIDFELAASVLKALGEVFGDYAIYAANAGDIVVVAKEKGRVGEPGSALYDHPEAAKLLERIGLPRRQDVARRKIADKTLLKDYLDRLDIKANSDYRPVLDQGAAKARFLRSHARDIFSIATEPVPALEMLGTRTLVEAPSQADAQDDFVLARHIRIASQFRDMVLKHGGSPIWAQAAPPALGDGVPDTAVSASLMSSCHRPPDGVDAIFVPLDIALKALPYLAPSEMQAIWEALKRLPCGQRVAQDAPEWLAFFQAVSSRDNDAVAVLAENLLASGRNLTPARVRYLVAAAMLAHLGRGDRESAAKLWQARARELFDGQQPRMMFRILAAKAL
jgi:spermidine synthase